MQKVVRTKMKTKVNWPGRCQASLVKPGDVFVTHKQAHMAVISGGGADDSEEARPHGPTMW